MAALLTDARHAALYLCLCALATGLGASISWAALKGSEPRSALVWATTGLLVLSLGGSIAEVYAARATIVPKLGACGLQLAELSAYDSGRWSSRLALWFIPASLLCIVGLARARRSALRLRLLGMAAPIGLLAWNGWLLKDEPPGAKLLFSGVCRLWDIRDGVHSTRVDQRWSSCGELRNVLDPKRAEYEKDADLLARALPDLSDLRRQCLDVLLAEIDAERSSSTADLVEHLDDPLVALDQREAFAERLNAIDRGRPDVTCSVSINICIGSRLPADVGADDAATALYVRASVRRLAMFLRDCAIRHDGVFHFTLKALAARDGEMRGATLEGIEGLDEVGKGDLERCVSPVLATWRVGHGLREEAAIRYRLWGAAPGIDGSR
jgi:hypothetical protein